MTLKNKNLRDDCDVLDVDLDQSDDGFELDLRVYHLRPKTAQLVGIHVSNLLGFSYPFQWIHPCATLLE
ncbi:hypothetical protein [Ktedonobacter robiniae]|uniref:Uncharacterized protein n=1 Tax=Ktedonobacter robiniae TaxID=2778365 RepID=A0ABQ3V629_9CHLR|nr:hypothetical protein [Ktedonobacter robiniae]GHO60403.1 hypothetical protein KSB_88780 [Ktedonobacter robiniae]